MELPKIVSINFFECENESCAHEINHLEKDKKYVMNCLFVAVMNEIYLDEVIVHNDHCNDIPEKPIEGVNIWSNDNFFSVGFWRVKYKNKS